MRRSNKIKKQNFSRRTLVLGGLQLAAFAGLSARLYQLQLVEGKNYSTRADGNRIRIFPVSTQRGDILDRNGKILAEGIQEYKAKYKVDKRVKPEELNKILTEVRTTLALDDAQFDALVAKVKKARSGQYITLHNKLSWNELAALEIAMPKLDGVRIETPEVRRYPYGKDVAHIIGYVGKPNEKELERIGGRSHPLYKYGEYTMGKTGLERKLEDRLKGQYGARQVEVDARGRYVRELSQTPGKSGENIKTTLHVGLQKYVVQQLKGVGGLDKEGASAVVLDVKNGDVLAMASLPSYDPDLFVHGMSHNEWNALINNPDKPLGNKAIASQYPPGSTFKTITALAGLQKGIINSKSTFFCPGHYELGGRRFHCWDRNGHGKINVEQAIEISCNVFFYNISTKIGIDEIARYAAKFGLGETHDIDLLGELSGLVPTKAWKEKALGKPWYRGETLNAAIGQGYCLTTPLQLAVQAARIASGGLEVKPRLLQGDDPNFGRIKGLSKAHINTVLRGMKEVVNEPQSSVYPHRITTPGMEFSGKTGTAQVVNRSFENLPQDARQRYHALFIGHAPSHAPRYAVSVVAEHGGYGSAVAAPIAGRILKKVQELGIS